MKRTSMSLLSRSFHSLAIPTNPFSERIESAELRATDALRRLAALTGIESADWPELITATQTIWRRPKGSEQVKPIFLDQAAECMELFKLLGLCNEVFPQGKEFKYGLLLGSTARQMAGRLDFLERLITDNTVAVETVVLLAGQRELWPEDYAYLDSVISNSQDCKTETDALYVLLQHTPSFPRLKERSITLIDAQTEAGDSRPRTINTVRDWIMTNPTPGACLAVSTNPHIPYQDLTLRTSLNSSFTLETCGPVDIDLQLQEDIATALCFDSLARWIWQHNEWKTELLNSRQAAS